MSGMRQNVADYVFAREVSHNVVIPITAWMHGGHSCFTALPGTAFRASVRAVQVSHLRGDNLWARFSTCFSGTRSAFQEKIRLE